MAEQRKKIELNTKNKAADEHHPMSVLASKKREPSLNKSAKKQVTKAKTQSFMEEFSTKQAEKKRKEEEEKGKKKKLKYNAGKDSDESDALSDSEPSDDNLDQD